MGIFDRVRSAEPSPLVANGLSQAANFAARGHGTAAAVTGAVVAAAVVAQDVLGSTATPAPPCDESAFTAPRPSMSDYRRWAREADGGS